MVVGQVPDEESHDRAHDQAGHELRGTDAMEEEARVGRGRRLGFAIEGVDHGRRIARRSKGKAAGCVYR